MEKTIEYNALLERLKASRDTFEILGILSIFKDFHCSTEASWTLTLVWRFMFEHLKYPAPEQIVQRYLNINVRNNPNFYKVVQLQGKLVVKNNVNVNSPESFYAETEADAVKYAEEVLGYKLVKSSY